MTAAMRTGGQVRRKNVNAKKTRKARMNAGRTVRNTAVTQRKEGEGWGCYPLKTRGKKWMRQSGLRSTRNDGQCENEEGMARGKAVRMNIWRNHNKESEIAIKRAILVMQKTDSLSLCVCV